VNFDPDVQVGQVRIFADTKEPLVAAVLASKGLAGWRLVPVSPYRVPASEAELVLGERVFQLWNACTAAKGFTERSWVVDTLTEGDVRRLTDGVAAARLTKLGDYERRHLTLGGDFRPWTAKFPQQRTIGWWRYGAWSAAAMIVLGLGVAWLVGRDGTSDEPSARVLTLRMERPERVAELSEEDAESPASADPLPEVAVTVAVETPSARPPEPAPDVRGVVRTPRMAPSVSAQVKPLGKDAVVAARPRAGAREGEVVKTLQWLKTTQRTDGSWGEKPLKDTALAVLALMAHGETSDSREYGEALTKGVRYLVETPTDKLSRLDRQVAACALCCASVAVRNPNVRVAAEKALSGLGDNRSVEAGRDWSGLLNDLATPAQKTESHDFRVADNRPEEDATAASCILVLQLLK